MLCSYVINNICANPHGTNWTNLHEQTEMDINESNSTNLSINSTANDKLVEKSIFMV